MKIDNRILNYNINQNLPKTIPDENSEVAAKQTIDDPKAEAKNGLKEETVVHFSKASKEAQLIQDVIAAQPDVRKDKVAEMKEKIESGNYRINHGAVSDKLVNDAIDELF